MTTPVNLVGARAVTVMQPWAHGIAHLGKTPENRVWTTKYRGTLLIHAGKGWDDAGEDALWARGFSDAWNALPAGAIVAVADLAFICDSSVFGRPCRCGDWAAAGQYHWNLTNVRPLANPVPCRGALGLWSPPATVIEQVAAQLGGR